MFRSKFKFRFASELISTLKSAYQTAIGVSTRHVVISLLGVALFSSYIFIQSEKKQPLVASSVETKNLNIHSKTKDPAQSPESK
jgi:hypothetical protein